MQHRYSLRFESGERKGETIPITGSGLTVGRKPGNTLQILDNSVSGSHAELVVDQGGVQLRDTGSTNGTRVGTQRVLEQQLSNGDIVTFGNVRMTFRDSQVGSAAKKGASAGGSASVESDGIELEGVELEGFEEGLDMPATPSSEAVIEVSPEIMARSRKKSFTGGIVVIAALLLVGGGVWFWLENSGAGPADAGRPVDSVAGNLIPQGYSFEGDADTWSGVEGAPAAFLRGSAHRSGAFGASADVDGGQWALYRSAPVRANAGHELTARGYLRTRGACEARLGIELANDLTADPALPANVVAWSAPITEAGGFEPVEVVTVVPPGWAEVRVVVLARSTGAKDNGVDDVSGSVDADDVSLVESGQSGAPAAKAGEASLYLLGTPSRSAQLERGERPLVTQITADVAPSSGDETDEWSGSPITARADGLKLFVQASGSDTASSNSGSSNTNSMQLRAEESLVHARVATITKEGYTTHGLDFERAGVVAILLGSGADLVRVKLEHPSSVKGKAEGSAMRLTITPAQPLEMQLDFAAERKEAGNIAYAARASEQKGDLGAAIVQWTSLLDGYPFEDALVNEAEAARSRLVQAGLEQLRRVQAEIERARFFRLADLYKKCRADALAVGAKYKQSEVDVEAQKVADAVTTEIDALEVDQHKIERQHMREILATLEAHKATGLAAEVRAYLTEKLSSQKADTAPPPPNGTAGDAKSGQPSSDQPMPGEHK